MNHYRRFFFFSNITLIVILLLQTMRALLVAIQSPVSLSQESVLCYEQGITLLMSIIAMSMHNSIFEKGGYNNMLIYFISLFQGGCIVICGLTMNILTYYGLQEGNEKTRTATFVFHIFVWIGIAPAVLFNQFAYCYIA